MEIQHFYWKTCKFVYLALFMDIKGSNYKSIYLPMCTCTPQTHIVEYKGGGVPVAQDVTSHRALKIQQK